MRGLFILAPGFAHAAVSNAKPALAQEVCVLAQLEEVVALVEREGDLGKLETRR